MLKEDKTQDHIHTFSSSKVFVEAKFRDSCSFSVSRDLMFSVDFSLTYELFKHSSLFKFDKFSVPSTRRKEPLVHRNDISLAVL